MEDNKLKGTKTYANLEAAFAGESMARNKYTYFASKAKKDGYEQIAGLINVLNAKVCELIANNAHKNNKTEIINAKLITDIYN